PISLSDIPQPPRSPLFPYTTLFRSIMAIGDGAFHYNPVPASFGASQEHRLPLLILLFDNAGYLSQKGDVVKEYPNGNAVRTKKRSEEHTSELQSRGHLVCRLLLEQK